LAGRASKSLSRLANFLLQEAAMFGLKRPETPFPRHWLYYMILKLVVLAAAVLLALYVFGIM
jgi:hypothetical protein